MIKFINLLGWTLAVSVYLTGETAPLPILLPMALGSAACLWLGNALRNEVLDHQYRVQNAPIATSVARDLRIEVKA